MHEHLQFAIGLLADRADLVERQLARQHHAPHAEPLREPHAFGAGDAHLRAAVDFQIRRDLARQRDSRPVLHDDRVGPGLGDRRERAGRGLQFVVEDQRVEGDVALDAAAVQRSHHLRQFGQREANLARAVKCLSPKYTASAPASMAACSCGQ